MFYRTVTTQSIYMSLSALERAAAQFIGIFKISSFTFLKCSRSAVLGVLIDLSGGNLFESDQSKLDRRSNT